MIHAYNEAVIIIFQIMINYEAVAASASLRGWRSSERVVSSAAAAASRDSAPLVSSAKLESLVSTATNKCMR